MGVFHRLIRETFFPPKLRYPKNIDHFELYQIKTTPESRKCMYMSLSMLKRMGYTLSKNRYVLVYTDTLDSCDYYRGIFLDAIFTRFNLYRPKNFRGRSMSVSDILVVYKNGERTTYYVDDGGYAQLPDDFWET